MEIQVIDDNLDYNTNFDKYLKEHSLYQRGSNYNTVAIIGCQSSGKSTLLNLLFDSEFEILDSQRGRMQTTKGIWMSKNPNGSILIFDIEGTDSKERGEQRLTFEQTTSLFALAIADVLLINMWTTDIGRYGASNYGLLRVIFEVNLKLFGQQSAKKLLFVLRDFDDRGNNFDRIKNIIDTDISNIWKEIYKPDQYKDSKPSDFFHFEFSMLPHKIYEEEKFYEGAKHLRNRFDTKAENTLFPSQEQKNVPMDGLSIFIDKTWEKIRTQKELNLPDQRIMVANLRCNELKEEGLEKVRVNIDLLKSASETQLIEDFSVKCLAVIQTAVTHYDEYAHQYDKTVFEKSRKDLGSLILSQLFICFENQMKMIRQNIFERFDREVRKLSSKDHVNEDFSNTTDSMFREYISSFKKLSADLVVQDSGWGQSVSIHESDLKSQLKSLLSHAREKEIDKLQNLTQQTAKDNLEQIINAPIYELTPTFWEDIRVPYLQEFKDLSYNCQQVLEDGFKCDKEEVMNFKSTLEQAIHTFSVDYVRRLFRDINTNLLRKFNKNFKKDENGKNRDWRAIEEPQIREDWGKCKATMEEVINDFKYIKLPKAALTSEETPDGGDNITPTYSRQFTVMFARLLTEQDLNRVKDKFNEDIDFVLEEAIRKHHNMQATSVPWWIYLLLLLFGYDNVIGWLSSPFLFYPLMLIVGGMALLYSLGLGNQMFFVARIAINQMLSRAHIDFQI